jgi:HIV Tat-specific factor 1
VILKRLFTLAELDTDDADEVEKEIIDDTREECSKFGAVEAINLFDAEPEGVMTVCFANATAANACVDKMNGRFYDGRRLEAKISDGTETFKKC